MIAVALGLIFATPVAGQEPNPMQIFLTAADENDFETMRSVMTERVLESRSGGMSIDRFISKIEDCYLRRVYSTPDEGRLMAAWMCAEGEDRSRVVIGRVWGTENGVQVSLSMEQSNRKPAPPRTGPAFAEDPK